MDVVARDHGPREHGVQADRVPVDSSAAPRKHTSVWTYEQMNVETVVASAVVAAAVSALVALLTEYAAKPSLEARKERILDERRNVWELADTLLVLDGRFLTLTNPRWWRQDYRRELLQAAESAKTLVGAAEDRLAKAPGSRLHKDMASGLTIVLGYMRLVAEQILTTKGEAVVELGYRDDMRSMVSDISEALQAPGRRILRTRRARRLARGLVAGAAVGRVAQDLVRSLPDAQEADWMSGRDSR